MLEKDAENKKAAWDLKILLFSVLAMFDRVSICVKYFVQTYMYVYDV